MSTNVRTRVALAVTLFLTASACGEGTLQFGGERTDNSNNNVFVVTGNISKTSPASSRDIVVFAFSDLVPAVARVSDQQASRDCNNARPFTDFLDAELVVLQTPIGDFRIDDIESGKLTIVFLLDEAGNLRDGTIDDGDPIAILDDPDGELEDVRSKLTVEIDHVEIDFTGASTTTPVCANPHFILKTPISN